MFDRTSRRELPLRVREILADPNRATSIFIILAATATLVMALQYTAIGSPMIEIDETSSASYAAALARWISPTIDTPSAYGTSGFPGIWMAAQGMPTHSTIWTANHPPAYHLLAVPAVWIANAIGTPGLALFVMRFISAASTAMVVVVSGRLARELLPKQPAVAMVAAAATAAMTTITFQGGFAYNDGFATATGGLALLVLARAARFGMTAGRVGWIACWCTASAGTRPTGVVLTVLVAIAVLLICLAQGCQRGRAVRLAAVVAIVPAVLVGWFYLRNIVLFGDVTASQVLMARSARQPAPELRTIPGILDYLRSQWDQLFIQRRLGRPSANRVHLIRDVGRIIAAGLLVNLVATVVRRRRSATATTRGPRQWSTVIVWATLAAVSVATILATTDALANGVGSHERYLMLIEPLVTICLGLGVVGLAGWIPHSRLRAVATAVAGAFGTGFFLVFGLWTHRVTVDWFTGFQLATGKRPLLGLGTADVLGVIAVILVGLCLVLCAAITVTQLIPGSGTPVKDHGRVVHRAAVDGAGADAPAPSIGQGVQPVPQRSSPRHARR